MFILVYLISFLDAVVDVVVADALPRSSSIVVIAIVIIVVVAFVGLRGFQGPFRGHGNCPRVLQGYTTLYTV